MKFSIILSFALLMCATLGSCIEDGYATSPSQQPYFSTDTLRIGTVWTGEASPTVRFTVHNPASANLRISSVALSGPQAGYFHINVDGMSGDSFSNVEIRPNDSIFVFAQAVLPENSTALQETFIADISFTTNGVTTTLPVKATSINAVTIGQAEITGDEVWDDPRPYRIMKSVSVAAEGSLTLAPGTRVMLHDGARIDVNGTLTAEGTPAAPVTLTGDRTGNVVGDISFQLMSRQWDGVYLHPSASVFLSHTSVSNTSSGVQATDATLTMVNCVMRNSGGDALAATDCKVEAIGCEFAEAAGAAVRIDGGEWLLSHCTIANFYLFAAQTEAAVCLENIASTTARIENCIIFSRGADLSHPDLTATDVTLHRCLLRSTGSDDANFIDCVWDADPLFITERSKYIFDYRLQAGSPAIGAAYTPSDPDPRAAVDRYGTPRITPADLGAYVFREEYSI